MMQVVLVPRCCSRMSVTDYMVTVYIYLLVRFFIAVDRWTGDVSNRNAAGRDLVRETPRMQGVPILPGKMGSRGPYFHGVPKI